MHTLDTRHQEVAGQWLPREWTLVDYDWKGSIRISYTFRVTELEVNREIDPRQFERKLEQGRIVRDHKDDKLYRVASSGELAPLQFDLEKTPGHGRAFLAIIIFVLALGVSFFALREVRRRFQRQAWGQQRQSE